ncbi:MAG: GDP-L-fucose synthase [Bacteriovoracaceae bacterium]|nr:GDP-L-fucose synthase [Bacteriovoracaceae bacterium]
MNKESKILILGSRGLVGSSLVRVFSSRGYENLIAPTRQELDLMDGSSVLSFFKDQKPEVVINAAAKVGGIHANSTYPADFIFENLTIQNNLFKAAFYTNVQNFLFLGSSCIYPKECQQPIKEEYLLTGPLEKTNEPYAVAKISGLKTAEYFRKQYGVNYFSVMPTNLYGENDNFHPDNSHVIPGLIRRMSEAVKNDLPEFEAWGTGEPRREFLFVDDLSEACLFLLESSDELPDVINVGTGVDVTIKELVSKIAKIMEYKGEILFNSDYPDGTPRKLLDVSRIERLGWKYRIELEEGLRKTIDYYNSTKDLRSY